MREKDLIFSNDKDVHHVTPKSMQEPFPNLDVFEYKGLSGQKLIIETDELATRCPLGPTHYPDQASLRIEYFPMDLVVELKSFKLFLHSFRERPISHEHATSLIAEVFANRIETPIFIEIDWNIRGGVNTTIQLLYDPNKDSALFGETLEDYLKNNDYLKA